MSAIDQDSAGAAANVGAQPARKATRRRMEPFAAVSVTVTLFGLFCLVPLWMIVGAP